MGGNKPIKIAVLGLGEAGSHFANDLLALGVTVAGYDPALRRDLLPSVIRADSPAEAARNALEQTGWVVKDAWQRLQSPGAL